MGKWDRRYYRPRFSRRSYQDYNWSPPRDEPCPDPETEEWQDNVPMWEKKFCYLVGRMPWKKVLSTKTFMHCHSNILNWDDSDAKDAFDNAKKRFWEGINNLPSASELPNPDMYNDEIDWNPCIDPQLVKELDQAYFNPDDRYYLPSERAKRNNGWQDGDNNPWEQTQLETSEVKDKATGWDNLASDDKNYPETTVNDRWGSHTKDSQTARDSSWGGGHNSWDATPEKCADTTQNWSSGQHNSWGANPEKCANATENWSSGQHNSWGAKPEECANTTQNWSSDQHNSWDAKPEKWANTTQNWSSGQHNSWGAKPENHADVAKNWSSDGPSSWRNDGKQWQDRGSHSKNWNQKSSELHRPNHPNNKYRQPQGYGGRGPSSGRGNSWGQKRWDNTSLRNNNNNNDDKWQAKEIRNNPRGGGQFNASCRKREGPDQYSVNHKGPRLQWGESHSSHDWNGANNNQKVTYGGQWS